MGGRRRRRRNDISRYNLNEYVRKRVDAIENNPFAFSYTTPSASYRGKFVEKVEDSYASLASYAYRGDSVVAACMRVRRDLFRQAKFCWREIDEAGPGKIFRTDELKLLDKPWPNGTTGELLARMITDIDLCGNSFIHHDGDRLRWLRPDWVSIVLSGDPQVDIDIDVLGYVYTPGGLDPEKNGHAYSPDEICHWAPEQDPLAFYRGMSWVSKALEEVQGDRAATTHKVAFFRNGATLGPIVRVPAGTSMQQFKDFMAAAEEAHAGAHNAYRTMYLGGGAEVTLAAADFRQLDLKSVQGGMETRIAAVAGVHPVLVGLSEGLAGSSLNSGNFAAARRATAEMTLYSLWQDACGALEAFFKVPDQAELWIRERDIPFLREEARDRAEIFKTQVLAIEAAMRAGFKPDPAVQATLEERLDLLIGAHTGLFSVQMQPPQSGMEGAPPLDVNGDGQPDEPGTPIDFGALRSDLWAFDDEDIERAVEEAFGDFDDEVVRDRYNVRVPKGFEGGGRFRKLSDRLVALLNDWAKGEGADDPLDEYSRDQLRRVAKELADKATASGDHERAARLTPRRGASSDEIKLALYKDVRAHVRGVRDDKLDNPRLAKFTLQQPGKLRDKDVAVYRMPGDKPALFHETDSGKRGGLVERFDDLDDMAKWADEHGETRLAEWARKEAGGKAERIKPSGRSLADVAAAVRRMGDEDDIATEIKDVRATDVRALADELNLTLPPAAKSATARKRYIAQTMAAHHRRTGGRLEHIGPLGRTTADEDRVIREALEEGRDARVALREFRANRAANLDADLTGTNGLSTDPAVRRVELDNRVREAYRDLRRPGEWVGLADLREHPALRDLSREQQDEALVGIIRFGDAYDASGTKSVRLIPVANTKALKPRDREASVYVGGEAQHAILFGDPSPRPLPGGAPRGEGGPAAPDELDDFHTGALADLARENGISVPSSPRETDRPAILEKLRAKGITRFPEDVQPAGPTPEEEAAHEAFLMDTLRRGAERGVWTQTQTMTGRAGDRNRAIDELRRRGLIRREGGRYALTRRGREALGAPSPAPTKKAPGGAPTSDLPDASDPEALRDALDLRTVDQLKAMLRQRGLPVSGRKRELVDRLVDGGGVGPKVEGAPTVVRAGHPYPGQRYTHGWVRVGVAATAARWHRDLEDLDELVAAVDSGEKKRHTLQGGQMGEVHLVDHNNGAETVAKRMGDVANTLGPGHPPERQADAEQLASTLGRKIGAPVPKVLRTGPDTVTMDVVYGDRWTDVEAQVDPADVHGLATLAAVRDRLVASREGVRLGVFDLLIGNWDRENGTNWLVEDDTNRPVGIDHAFAWTDYAEGDAADPPPGYGIGPFAESFVHPLTPHHRRWSPTGPPPPLSWADNPLTPADVEFLRRQLADLEDDFTRLGRHDWWQFAMVRLDAIAPYATGKEPIFT